MIRKALLLSLMQCSLMFPSNELETAIRELDVRRVEHILNQEDQTFSDLYLVGLVEGLDWQITDYKARCYDEKLLGLIGGFASGIAGVVTITKCVVKNEWLARLLKKEEVARAYSLCFMLGGPIMGLWLANKSCLKFDTRKAHAIIDLLLKHLSSEQRVCVRTPGLFDKDRTVPACS